MYMRKNNIIKKIFREHQDITKTKHYNLILFLQVYVGSVKEHHKACV